MLVGTGPNLYQTVAETVDLTQLPAPAGCVLPSARLRLGTVVRVCQPAAREPPLTGMLSYWTFGHTSSLLSFCIGYWVPGSLGSLGSEDPEPD